MDQDEAQRIAENKLEVKSGGRLRSPLAQGSWGWVFPVSDWDASEGASTSPSPAIVVFVSAVTGSAWLQDLSTWGSGREELTKSVESLDVKSKEQAAFRLKREFHQIGYGPSATSDGGEGWRMSAELCLHCRECGYLMSADPATGDACFCGALYKDVDAGRVGSQFGDDAIAVYEIRE